MITVYLTEIEKEQIEKICQEHGCNCHSVVKAGLHLLLDDETSKRGILNSEQNLKQAKKTEKQDKPKEEGSYLLLDESREEPQSEEKAKSQLRKLAAALRKQESEHSRSKS